MKQSMWLQRKKALETTCLPELNRISKATWSSKRSARAPLPKKRELFERRIEKLCDGYIEPGAHHSYTATSHLLSHMISGLIISIGKTHRHSTGVDTQKHLMS